MQTIKGFSLIEVLVSFILLSLILLGLNATQLLTLRATEIAYETSVAIQQAHCFHERLKIGKINNLERLIAKWNKQNANLLPKGEGAMSGIHPNYLLTVVWGGKLVNECSQTKTGKKGCLLFPINLAEAHF